MTTPAGIVAKVLPVLVCAAVFSSAAGAATGALSAQKASSTHAVLLGSLESGMLSDVNAIRSQHQLMPVRLSAPLMASARQHTREMATDGYFTHASVGGGAFWVRIQRYYASSGFPYWSVGENLLWSSADVTANSALLLWMASPEHRVNLLDPRWRDLGVSALHENAAPGVFEDLPVTIVTMDFGARRS